MKFVADEGVDAPIVQHLRWAGYQVWYVAEMAPGIADTVVLTLANQEEPILLTADKDFGDLVFRQQRVSQGVLLLRLHGIPPEQKAETVTAVIQKYETQLVRTFTVITPQKVRVRPFFHQLSSVSKMRR